MSISPPLSRLHFKLLACTFWDPADALADKENKDFPFFSKFVLLWINPNELHDAGPETLGIKGRCQHGRVIVTCLELKCLVSWVPPQFIRRTPISTWSQSHPQPPYPPLFCNRGPEGIMMRGQVSPTTWSGELDGCVVAISGPSFIILFKSFMILVCTLNSKFHMLLYRVNIGSFLFFLNLPFKK